MHSIRVARKGLLSSAGQNTRQKDVFLVVTAQLNHKLMPLDRSERYEDPLQDELEKHGFGETDGGGTMTEKSGEIEYIDVELRLVRTHKSIPFVINRLESYGAAKGSKLVIIEGRKRREIPFGKIEGFGVYLDGVNLPDEVYNASDVNLVIKEFNKRLKGHGGVQSYWQGPNETALYIYGDSVEKMKAKIADFIAAYPLCKGARVVSVAPKASERCGLTNPCRQRGMAGPVPLRGSRYLIPRA